MKVNLKNNGHSLLNYTSLSFHPISATNLELIKDLTSLGSTIYSGTKMYRKITVRLAKANQDLVDYINVSRATEPSQKPESTKSSCYPLCILMPATPTQMFPSALAPLNSKSALERSPTLLLYILPWPKLWQGWKIIISNGIPT